MWKNYFKTAAKTLLRNKNYTLLNISGLSIGMAVCLVIFMIINFETNYDGFHKNKDRIHRVLTEYTNDANGAALTSGVPAPLPAALKNDFPFLGVADISSYPAVPVSVLKPTGGIAKNLKTTVFFTEPSFFDIFDFEQADGNPKAALADPNTAVLTKSTAALFFGDWKLAMGEVINVNKDFTVKIGAVIDDVPDQTDFQLKLILPNQLLNHEKSADWTSITGSQQCYVLLPAGMRPETFDQQLKVFSKKHRDADDRTICRLQPLSNVHYDAANVYQGVANFSGKNITGERVRLLWLIAAFILVIACVNFINLTTTQAVKRAKEIGVPRVMGSNKVQLMLQFLTETFLLVLSAVCFALLFVLLVAESVGGIINIPIALKDVPLKFLLNFLVIVVVSVTLLAGLYPALVLSGFNPINALKRKTRSSRTRGLSLRPVLVVVQFVIAHIG